jgi:hypothetical protein
MLVGRVFLLGNSGGEGPLSLVDPWFSKGGTLSIPLVYP